MSYRSVSGSESEASSDAGISTVPEKQPNRYTASVRLSYRTCKEAYFILDF